MSSRNAEFFQKYKALDKLCSEIYGEKNGVTQYIDDMISLTPSDSRTVPGWENTIKELKRHRYFRNELAHGDLEMDGNNCDEEDIEWISDFRDKIMACEDPIAKLRKIRQRKNIVDHRNNTSYKNTSNNAGYLSYDNINKVIQDKQDQYQNVYPYKNEKNNYLNSYKAQSYKGKNKDSKKIVNVVLDTIKTILILALLYFFFQIIIKLGET